MSSRPPTEARLLRHGDTIDLGHVRIDVRHTPGHTPEHLCFVVTDRAASDRPVGMFSGDFIFVGDVGRPDLLERAANVAGTMESLARDLFRSLRATKDLPDYLQLWPGTRRRLRLRKIARRHALDDARLRAPRELGVQYYRRIRIRSPGARRPAGAASLLRDDEDRESRRSTEHAGVRRPAGTDAAERSSGRSKAGTPVVDVRATADFAAAHIPGTINLPMGSSFATWAGSLAAVRPRLSFYSADDPRRIGRARHGLTLIGLDRVVAAGGKSVREAWRAAHGPLQTVRQVDVNQLAEDNNRPCARRPPVDRVARGAHAARGALLPRRSRGAEPRPSARHTDRRALPGRDAVGDRRESAPGAGFHQRRQRRRRDSGLDGGGLPVDHS